MSEEPQLANTDARPQAVPDLQFPSPEIRQQRTLAHLLADRQFWATWWLPIASLLLAVSLVSISMRARGPRLVVRFPEGHGLQAGNTVRYLGIDVGEVTEVQLNRQADGVDVVLRLEPNSEHLAREGTRFWIERPRVSLSRVSGLETVVGAKYVGLSPGAANGPVVHEFDGLANPPALATTESDEITIRFLQGHGLAVGDPLKHRGIIVGEVTSVELNAALESVVVRLRLLGSARPLARAGSQFWIERPKVSLVNTRGLDTLVTGRYLAVLPGAADAEPQNEFDGLETPPASEERLEGGLEVILESPHRHGLEVGAPLSYRGLAIGHVIAVGLAPDASVVEARAYVQPRYKSLVRENSRFWSMSGFDVDLGITGLKLTAETLATIAAGGVAMATPAEPGKSVATGHRFPLHEKGDDDWSTWQPRMALTNPALPPTSPLPQPLRASLRWKEKKFGFSRQRQRDGWVLLLEENRLLGPSDLVAIPEQAIDQLATLELGGGEFPLAAKSIKSFGDLSICTLSTGLKVATPPLPRTQLRTASQLEDGVLVPGWQESSTVLAAAHLKVSDSTWQIASYIPIPADLHGAAFVSSADGKLVGITIAEKGRAHIAVLSDAALKSLE